MIDRRLTIYRRTLAILDGDAKSLANVTDDVNRLLREENPAGPVSQVDVLVAASVLGRNTIRVTERADGAWLERTGVT